MSPDRRTLLALFSLVFGLRVLGAAALAGNTEINPSPLTYAYGMAERIHDNLGWITQPFTPGAPGYITALAAVFRVFGVSWWIAVLFNAFIGGASAVVIYRIGEKRLAKGIGLLSALWFGLSVPHIVYSMYIVRDVLTTFCLLWICYLVSKRYGTMGDSVWAAIAYTLLVYVEPMFLIFLPVIVVYFAVAATKHRLLNTQHVFLFLAALFVLNVPWTIRNYAVYGQFVPVSLEASLYTGSLKRAFTNGEDEVGDAGKGGVRTHPPSFASNMMEFWRVVRVADYPGDENTGRPPEPAWSHRHNAINVISYGLLIPFFVAGIMLALSRRARAPLVLSFAIVSYAVLRGFLGGSEASRLVVQPLIILVALYGLMTLWGEIRAGKSTDA